MRTPYEIRTTEEIKAEKDLMRRLFGDEFSALETRIRRETAEECARIAREFASYMLVDLESAIRAKFGLKDGPEGDH